MLLVSILATVIACLSMYLEGPVSVTTLGGMNAMFHCNGSGIVLAWEVEGIPHNDQTITDRGITEYTVSSSCRHSTVHPHCTSNISEQWHYCTMFYWFIVQFISSW